MKCPPLLCYLVAAHRSEVNDEAVALIKVGPAERDLGRPDDTPALDVEQPPGRKVIGDHMVEACGHSSCLSGREKGTESAWSR